MIPLKKIIVVRLSSIGDIVLASPLLRVLKKKYPDCKIDFVVKKEYSELIKYNPNVSNIFEFDSVEGFNGLKKLKKIIKEEKYDLFIDLHNNLRSIYLRCCNKVRNTVVMNKRVIQRIILVLFKKNYYKEIIPVPMRYLELVKDYGIEYDNMGLEIYISDSIYKKVFSDITSLKLEEYPIIYGFCPSAKHKTKCWPKEYFIQLGIKLILEHKAKVLVFGDHFDKDLCSSLVEEINKRTKSQNAVDLSGNYTLLENAVIMKLCNVMVTNDTGLMHIAAAMKRKVIAIFGSTVSEFGFIPFGTRYKIIERSGLKCRPCSHIGKKECPKKHFRCMKDIKVGDVYNAISQIK